MTRGEAPAAAPAPRPVINPIRVLLVDPVAAGSAALARAIDLDPAMAVVGRCRDLRQAAAETDRCAPDLVAVRIGPGDPRCADLLAALAAAAARPSVAVMGANGAPLAAGEAIRLAIRIKAVAETARGRGAPVAALLAAEPVGSRLN